MRVAFFIDGKNFYKAWQRKAGSVPLDYNRLVVWVIGQIAPGGGSFVGAHYYTGYKGSSGDPNAIGGEAGPALNSFLNVLAAQTGFFVTREPRVKRKVKCPRCEQRYEYEAEKRVDVRIATDIVHYAAVDAYDIAVLFSGDQDFIPAAEQVGRFGKQVYIGSWDHAGVSKDLRACCYGEIDILPGVGQFARDPQTVPVLVHTEADTDPIDATLGEDNFISEAVIAIQEQDEDFTDLDEIVLSEIGKARESFAQTGRPLSGTHLSLWSGFAQQGISPDQVMASVARLTEVGRVCEYRCDYDGRSVQAIRINDSP